MIGFYVKYLYPTGFHTENDILAESVASYILSAFVDF